MSIERVHGRMWLQCDDCGQEVTTDYRHNEFEDMIEEAKEDDWYIRKDKFENWKHTCPKCLE